MKRTILLSMAPLAISLMAGCERSATDGGTAVEDRPMPAMPGMPQQSEQRGAEHMAQGTLNSIDRAAAIVNITHGPVASASWPGMTMSFKLADPSAGENLAPGQKVDFHFTIESGMSATVTQISPAE